MNVKTTKVPIGIEGRAIPPPEDGRGSGISGGASGFAASRAESYQGKPPEVSADLTARSASEDAEPAAAVPATTASDRATRRALSRRVAIGRRPPRRRPGPS